MCRRQRRRAAKKLNQQSRTGRLFSEIPSFHSRNPPKISLSVLDPLDSLCPTPSERISGVMNELSHSSDEPIGFAQDAGVGAKSRKSDISCDWNREGRLVGDSQ